MTDNVTRVMVRWGGVYRPHLSGRHSNPQQHNMKNKQQTIYTRSNRTKTQNLQRNKRKGQASGEVVPDYLDLQKSKSTKTKTTISKNSFADQPEVGAFRHLSVFLRKVVPQEALRNLSISYLRDSEDKLKEDIRHFRFLRYSNVFEAKLLKKRLI